MKFYLLLTAYFLFFCFNCKAQEFGIRPSDLINLIDSTISKTNVVLSQHDWKLASSRTIYQSKKSYKIFDWGYRLGKHNYKIASAWIEVVVRYNSVIEIDYQFDSGDEYKNVIDELEKQNAIETATVTNKGDIATTYVKNGFKFILETIKPTKVRTSAYIFTTQISN